MAAILERKRTMNLTWQDIADEVGMSGESMRKLANKPPMSWDKYTREKVCKSLGIQVRSYVVGSPEDRDYATL